MKPLSQFKSSIKVLFTDIDDTLTTNGRLPSQSYEMLWKLYDSGIDVVPVTGRPAGWCEMIARMWPVLGVVGENGALSFQYKNKKMHRTFIIDENLRIENSKKLKIIEEEILAKVPGCAIASDQFTRLFDLAVDFCEDVPPLNEGDIATIVSIFKKYGATAKVSSIHVNGWFGDYDKKKMCETFYKQNFDADLNNNQDQVAFVGDSPNDEPLFGFFDNSFAVSNILQFQDQIKLKPSYISQEPGGKGFVEIAEKILELSNNYDSRDFTPTSFIPRISH